MLLISWMQLMSLGSHVSVMLHAGMQVITSKTNVFSIIIISIQLQALFSQ